MTFWPLEHQGQWAGGRFPLALTRAWLTSPDPRPRLYHALIPPTGSRRPASVTCSLS